MVKVAVILIYNSKGDLALQLRAAGDDSYPLHWDFSAGGGVDTGEDAPIAAQREVFEELGISLPLTQTDSFTYANVRVFDSTYSYTSAEDTDETVVFSGVYDGEFLPDKKEVQEMRFFDDRSLRSIVNSEKFHPELGYFLRERLLK